MKALLPIVCALAMLTGCATVAARCGEGVGEQVYPATLLDALAIAYMTDDMCKKGDELHCLVIALTVVDLVPSLVTDTVLLPIDLVVMAVK